MTCFIVINNVFAVAGCVSQPSMDQSDGEEDCDETVATCDDERVTHDTSVTNISVESEGR